MSRALLLPTFDSPLDAARWWIDQGYSPISIPARSKNPGLLHGEDWHKLRIDRSNVHNYFNGVPCNIGILLGLGDAVDIDLDWPEAAKVGPAFLPSTGMIWGRDSAPRTHFLYKSNGAVTKQFKDPLAPEEKKTVAELRAQTKKGAIGLQSVVPPGVHHTGERIAFASADPPAVVAPDALLEAVSKVASAALLARYWPKRGRHDAMLALGGLLARAGWPINDAKTFCRELYAAVATHDPSQLTRSDSEVESTYAKHTSGEETTGLPTLVKSIDSRVIEAVCGWLGIAVEKSSDRHRLNDGWPLLRAKNGEPLRVVGNAVVALRSDPELAGLLAFDDFTQSLVSTRRTPWNTGPGEWNDVDDSNLCVWIGNYGIHIPSRMASEAVNIVAGENRTHPLQEFLTACGAAWDGQPRIERWLSDYLGCEETEYTRAVGRAFLIAAVARAFEPGCKSDHTLLLEGPQGSKKSTALRTLAGDAWFSDTISAFGSKDSREELLGVWICELAELDRIRGAALERTKSFLSTSCDRFRKSYGRRAGVYPRTTVFCGSTNDSTYLCDETGARRFWPVKIGEIKIGDLQRDRAQLWGEAVMAYRAGDAWWLWPDQEKLARVEQDQRYERGARDELVERWIAEPMRFDEFSEEWFGSKCGRINITDVLLHGLRLNKAQVKAADSREVARCLRHLGYSRVEQERAGEYRGVRYYVAPEVRS